jgi:hypothetical protein
LTCIQNVTLITAKFKSGGRHEKHVVALGNLGTSSAFAFRPRETKKNLGPEIPLFSRYKIYRS